MQSDRATLERIAAFVRWSEDSTSARATPSRFGTALYHDEFPDRWDSNFLRLERRLEGVAAAEIAAEADELFQAFDHRKVVAPEGTAGDGLAIGFGELGWSIDRLIYMSLRRSPDRTPDVSSVSEVTVNDVRAVQLETNRADGSMTEPVRAMLVDFRRVLADRLGARFFLAHVNGEPAAYCELYRDETGVAQIEDVNTLERFRGRGLARAVVWQAAQQARASGDDLVFLMADDHDWPKEMYAKLGFDPIGHFWQYTRRPREASA